MKKVLIAVLVIILLISGAVSTSAENLPKEDGAFKPVFSVQEDYNMPYFNISNNFAYNSVFVNSKGEVWVLDMEGKYGDIMYMYRLDLKSRKVKEKVYIGAFFSIPQLVPSLNGRYLYIPVVKLEKNQIYINSYSFVCFDLEKGNVAWRKPIASSDYYAYFGSLLPVKNGVIISYHKEKWGKEENNDETMRISNSGEVLWKKPYECLIFAAEGETAFASMYDRKSKKSSVVSINIADGTVKELIKDGIDVYPPLNLGIQRNNNAPDNPLSYCPSGVPIRNSKGDVVGILKWTLYSFRRVNGKYELDVLTDPLPVRIWDGDATGDNFIPTVYNGYFVFIDSPKLGDQNIYVYNKDGKVVWHRDVMPAKGLHRTNIMPIFSNGMLFYGNGNTVYAVDIATGKDVYTLKIGDFTQCGIFAASKSEGVWAWGFNGKDKSHIHLLKLGFSKSYLTVNANISNADYVIKQGDAEETAKFGDKVVLPPGTYTLHFNESATEGLQSPEDVTVELKDGDSKVLNVEYKDTEPPELTVDPIEKPVVMNNTAFFKITGMVKDNFSGVKSVSVNGMFMDVGKDGKFAGTILVYRTGSITFDVVAYDNAGNKAEKKIQVEYNPPIVITLKPDSPVMLVNGEKKQLDSPPVIIPKWGRTVVPIRAIVEALGGTISWDGKERKVTINFNGTTIELWIGKSIAEVNGVDKWIDPANHDVKPIIVNGRTMLPLRFVAENLGCTVKWDPVTRTITITYEAP